MVRAAEQADLIGRLHRAMRSRSVVDQALRVVMHRRRCIADEAFDLLRAAGEASGQEVAAVAADSS